MDENSVFLDLKTSETTFYSSFWREGIPQRLDAFRNMFLYVIEHRSSYSMCMLVALVAVQLCATLRDCSQTGSSVYGMPQARISEGADFHFLLQEILSDSGIESMSLMSPCLG